MTGIATIGREQQVPFYAPRLWVPLGVATCLMLASFSFPGRSTPSGFGSLDWIAWFKVTMRLGSLTLLGCVIMAHWQNPYRAGILKCLAPLVLFVFWALLSVLWSPMRAVSLGQMAGLLALVMLAVVVALAYRNEETVTCVVRFLSISLVLVSISVLIAYFAMPSMGALGRRGSGVMHATNASASASLGLLISLTACWHWRRRFDIALALPAVIVHGLVLALAMNRASIFLALVLGSATCLLGLRRHSRLAAILVLSLVGCTYLAADPGLALVDSTASKTFGWARRGQSVNELMAISGREEMWTAMWRSYTEAPVMGHGFFVTSNNGRLSVWSIRGNWTAHNCVLQILTTTGIIGALLMFGGLICIAGRVALACLGGTFDNRLGVLLCLASLWYLGWGIFNSSFCGPVVPESVVMYSLLGLAVGKLAGAGAVAVPASLASTSDVPGMSRFAPAFGASPGGAP